MSGGFIDKVLDKIPGYGGYRDKERRRDSDRLIRENLATDYRLLADRLGRIATNLAEQRKIMQIATVDRPHKRLLAFIDRVETATYGYAPIFSDAPVDGAALDQLALFDRSLADQVDVLDAQISSMEGMDAAAPEFKAAADAISSTADGLHTRFAKRHEVIHSARALPERDIVGLLDMQTPNETPDAYRLKTGEALAFETVNYSVSGLVTCDGNDLHLHAFQLRGGDDDHWLVASARVAEPLLMARRVEPAGGVDGESITIGASTYTRQQLHQGTGEVVGPSGEATNQPVRLMQFSADGAEPVALVFRWTSGFLALIGRNVTHAEIDVFTRER